MKQENKRRWKTYAKILIPIVLVLGLISYSVITMNVQGLPDKTSVEDSDLSGKFQKAIDNNSILTLKGSDEKMEYEWFYAEHTIISSKDTDLKVYISHQYDDFVIQALQVTNVFGFYYAENIELNGFPELTITIRDWTADDCRLYKLSGEKLTRVDTALAVNSDKKGEIQVTFQVSETDGIFYLVGGSHNYNLQGQGTANHVKPVSDSHEKSDKNPAKQVKTGDSKKGDGKQPLQHEKKYVNDSKPSGKETKLYTVITRILSDGSRTSQDKYKTDPVPVGKPEPVEPEDVKINYKKSYTCTLSIDCKTILKNKKDLTKGKEKCVPEDGWILKKSNVLFYEGESVFDVLLRETQKRSIQMEYSMTPIYNSNYIEGIQNLYEFDCGSASGWMYHVNGWYPNYGCSRYLLQENDVIEWRYTCDYGADVGCDLIVK